MHTMRETTTQYNSTVRNFLIVLDNYCARRVLLTRQSRESAWSWLLKLSQTLLFSKYSGLRKAWLLLITFDKVWQNICRKIFPPCTVQYSDLLTNEAVYSNHNASTVSSRTEHRCNHTTIKSSGQIRVDL